MGDEIRQLKIENKELKEKLDNYIPRRRLRRVFNAFKDILVKDIANDETQYLAILKVLVDRIAKDGKVEVGKETQIALEYLLRNYELNMFNSNEN